MRTVKPQVLYVTAIIVIISFVLWIAALFVVGAQARSSGHEGRLAPASPPGGEPPLLCPGGRANHSSSTYTKV